MITYLFLAIAALVIAIAIYGPKGYRTLLAFAVAAVAPVLDVLLQIVALPEWQGFIPQEWWPAWSLGLSVLGIILRAKTSTPIGRDHE